MRKTLDFISGSFITKAFLVIIGLIIVVFAIFVYKNPTEPLSLLLNSNYLVAVITGIAGTVAFLIYFKQKSDTKRYTYPNKSDRKKLKLRYEKRNNEKKLHTGF